MYDNHFQRVEEKYLLNEEQKEIFLKKIKTYIEKDKFYISNIHNIYFDDCNNDLIINSLEKPIFKDKYRIRSYGIPNIDDDVFFEIKTKYNGIVGKRRIKIKLKEYYEYIENNKKNNNQIFNEIDYYFRYYHLKPAIYIAYDRQSYIGVDNKNLRITFDSNLRSRRSNLYFKDEESLENYFSDNMYIMEIKTVGSMPLWLVRILSEMNIMPTSFSKYGKIYEKEMEKIKYA